MEVSTVSTASMICKDLRGSRVGRWAVAGLLVYVLLAFCVPIIIGVKFGADFPCPFDLSAPLMNATVYPNGSASDSGTLYPEGHHFSVNGTPRGCLCSLRPCVRKCCGNDEHYVARRTCGYNTEYSFDNSTLEVYKNTKEFTKVPTTKFGILYGNVCYYGMFPLDPSTYPRDKHYLMEDGRILLFRSNHEEVYLDATQYCLDSIKGSNIIRTFVCVIPVEDRYTTISFKVYPIFLFISALFLFSTFLVYCVIPELHNLQGKSQMCHIVSLLTAYVGLIILNLKIAIGNWCKICGEFI